MKKKSIDWRDWHKEPDEEHTCENCYYNSNGQCRKWGHADIKDPRSGNCGEWCAE